MNLSDKQHHLRMSLRETERDMRSISPRLALYAKLQEKANKIRKQLEEMGAKRTMVDAGMV